MDFLKADQFLFPLPSCLVSGGLSLILGFLTTRLIFSSKAGVVILTASTCSGDGSFTIKAADSSSLGENWK